MTSCEGHASAARLYREATNEGLAPVLRRHRLNMAIQAWNKCNVDITGTIDANLARAHARLVMLKAPAAGGRIGEEFMLAISERRFHCKRSLEHFEAAFKFGKSNAKFFDAYASSFVLLVTLQSESPLSEQLKLESAALALPLPLQPDGMFHVADAVWKAGIKALESGEWWPALKAFCEAERPIIRATELCQKSPALRSSFDLKLQELYDSNTLHMIIAEGRQAIAAGDSLINAAVADSEQIDMEGVWSGLDKYSEAAVLGHGRDIETEAIAIARRGKVYAKVFRNESLARPLLVHATALAASLAPRSFHGVYWYEACTKQLKKYQDASATADERAKERERQAILKSQEATRKKLKPELDDLNRVAKDLKVFALLKHICEKYPPRVDPAKAEALVKNATSDTIKKVLVQMQTHYHPDTNPESKYGCEWHVLCCEIAKHLNGKYNCLKAI
mmetsp:Transcript_396/g.1278  ORF Transcript_396/g.1278 Transcript_396/m.1278 type:complete len:449 (+) Transcript_396:77-1423(+)